MTDTNNNGNKPKKNIWKITLKSFLLVTFIFVIFYILFRLIIFVFMLHTISTYNKNINVKTETPQNQVQQVTIKTNKKKKEPLKILIEGKEFIIDDNSEYTFAKKSFDNNYIIGTKNGNEGVVRFDGKLIIKPEYNQIRDCGNRYYCAYKNSIADSTRKTYLIDFDGNILLEDNSIEPMFTNFRKKITNMIISTDNIPINNSGNAILHYKIYDGEANKLFECDTVDTPFLIKDKYIKTEINFTMTLYDLKGNIIIPPKDYKNISDVVEKDNVEYFFVVAKGGNLGIIDRNGKVYIPPEYDNYSFDENTFDYFWVKVPSLYGDRYVCLNLFGEKIDNPDMSKAPNGETTILSDDDEPEYFDGTKNPIQNGYYFKRNQNNKLIGIGRYKSIINGKDNFYHIMGFNNKWGVADSNGKVIAPMEYSAKCRYYKYEKRFYCPKSFIIINLSSLKIPCCGYTNDYVYDLNGKYLGRTKYKSN